MADIVAGKGFKEWVASVKGQIRSTQIKAAMKVNSEMLHLYWQLGAQIVEKQKTANWGSGFLQSLSNELLEEFPQMKGFSYKGLRCIHQWYVYYNQELTAQDGGNSVIWKQLVSKLDEGFPKASEEEATTESPIRPQVVAKLGEGFFNVPWGHHLYIMRQAKSLDEAAFYLRKTVEGNWSRSVLLNIMSTDLYHREGKAITNFERTLPSGDLAQQLTRDPYIFDLMAIREPYLERELEDALVHNISRMLLEMGRGFAYVGRQVPLEVGEETLYADLLFYNIDLHCYVVVELKTTKFCPEYIGQLMAYVSATDHLKRRPADGPTLGLLICKTKNDVLAQWTLENVPQPLGISSYELAKIMPDHIKSSLPTIEEIEAGIAQM